MMRIPLLLVIACALAGCSTPERAPARRSSPAQGDSATQRLASPNRETATGFPDYDASLIAAIQARWLALQAEPSAAPAGDKKGKVVVEFILHSTGRVTDVRAVETNVSDAKTSLCERAVGEPAPYPTWSPEMVAKIGAKRRLIRFAFNYD